MMRQDIVLVFRRRVPSLKPSSLIVRPPWVEVTMQQCHRVDKQDLLFACMMVELDLLHKLPKLPVFENDSHLNGSWWKQSTGHTIGLTAEAVVADCT